MSSSRSSLPAASYGRCVASFLAVASSALAQQEAWRHQGVRLRESLGHSIAVVDDRDGDGTRDLLAGAPGEAGYGLRGRALLLSGRTLALLRTYAAPAGTNLGEAVGDAGDVDGDGVTDHFVGSGDSVLAHVHSGATGALLRQWSSSDPLDRFGAHGLGLGDVDGDGFGDVAIGAPLEQVGADRPGVVHVMSGATGLQLWSVAGSHATAALGDSHRMANLGDLDGDGIDELGLLDVQQAGGAPFSAVRVVSGASGLDHLVVPFDSGARRASRLTSIAAFGDLDGDGTRDLLVGGLPFDPSTVPGRAFVLSGADGSTLLRVDLGDQPAWFFVGSGGDVDGDLVEDLVVSTSDQRTGGPDPLLSLHRGSDGVAIGSFSGTIGTWAGRTFAAGVDLDGDTIPDLVVGEETADRDNVNTGELSTRRWPGGGYIARLAGEGADRRFRGAIAQIGDFDGDGATDFVVADPETPAFATDDLRVHSGRDGSELGRHAIAAEPDGELIALPDLDGDGIDDVAVGDAIGSLFPAVEVRSTGTGALLLRLPGPGNAITRFGEQLAVGVQSSGAVHLAVGAPRSSAGKNNAGAVDVYDLATGALVFQRLGTWPGEFLGTDVAWLDDVNGDGTGDWAFGAPQNGSVAPGAGRVLVVSGKAGGTLQVLQGASSDQWFGQRVAGLGDLDGDGISELAVTALLTGGNYTGEVIVHAGGAWNVLGTVTGERPGDNYGLRLGALADVNGDAVPDLLAQGVAPLRWDIRSGATFGLLARLPVPASSTLAATPAPWNAGGSTNGDAIPDLVFSDPFDPGALSSAWSVVLDELMLQVVPGSAPAGETVFAHVRGGPIGSPAALELVTVNGVAMNLFVDAGTFNALGTWFSSGDVPPGLSGTTWTLRGWAIGFGGGVVATPEQPLEFD